MAFHLFGVCLHIPGVFHFGGWFCETSVGVSFRGGGEIPMGCFGGVAVQIPLECFTLGGSVMKHLKCVLFRKFCCDLKLG